MTRIHTSLDELVGNTPLLELVRFERQLDLKARVLVKLERQNPAGSVKDRVALNMLNEAEAAGVIAPDAGSVLLHGGEPSFEHVVSVVIVNALHVAQIVPLVTLA